MKHFVLYFLAALLIVTMLGRFAAAETVEGAEPTAALLAAVTKNSADDEGEGEEEPEAPTEILTGLLQVNLSSMDDMYFKSALTQELGEGFSIHALSTSDDNDDQLVMFRKMVEKGYKLIIVELYSTSMADEYIDLAKENGITLIFTGNEPRKDQMARMENLYYVGFSSGNTMRVLADAIIQGWTNNQYALEVKSDDLLRYAFFTQEDYEENGNQEALEEYLAAADIPVELAKNVVTQAFDFNWKKEVDNIFYAGGEIIICDSSSFARQISDYLHDDEEYPEEQYPRIREACIFLTVADEAAQAMIEEGTAVFGTGINGGDTGAVVGKLAKVLMAGEKPTAENIGVAPDENKSISVTNRTLLADRLTTRPTNDESDYGHDY